ncbi:hypothetical protein CONLIGDRAFT_368949 [Coniochaeta ligniaria NRRL 30616]|uniref:Nephrocystin 3-like N-terminal domain-containing protein n=1 Tax=Coniochaeta ligniaria NRRL 30616 TaxID=1408157 RepID=A0A1J7JKN4_9PEZI|nr:hypothetical protein CONLIGDRAFT_368949 [Coniochaeta ligniaria NRRL 30616]
MESHLLDVQAALSTSEQLYKKVTRCARSTTATLDRQHLHHASRLIRDISASLYQVHLTLSTAQDDRPSTVGENFNLYHIHRCQQLLGDLDRSMGTGPLDGLHGRLLEAGQAESKVQDLAQANAQLALAVAADIPFAVLRALSQPEMLAIPGRADVHVHLPDRPPSDGRWEIPTVRGIPNPAAVARWADSRLNTYLRLRTPGSLDMMLQNTLIQSWLAGHTPRLWLYGKRGSGKTVLASAVLEQLLNQTRHDPTTAVCYYISDQPERWARGSKVFLAGLYGQLAQQNPKANMILSASLNPHLIPDPTGLPRFVKDTLEEGKSYLREEAPYFGCIHKRLESCFRKVFIIVDGFNERGPESLGARAVLYNHFDRPGTANGASVTSILALSREPSDAGTALCFRRAGYQALDITPDPAQIRVYVRSRLSEHTRINPALSPSPEQGERIVEAIVSATRVFRVAELQVDYLLSVGSEAERNAALLTLPTELQELYSLLLTRLSDPHERDLVHTTVRWLQELTPDELSLHQLCECVAIFLARGAKSLADIPAIPEVQVLRLCTGLVRRTLNGSAIELAHRTVQETWPANTSNARYEIGIACLRLLNFQDFTYAAKEFRLEQERTTRRDVSHPFYRYAAEAWMDVLPGDDVDEALEQEFMHEACHLFSSCRSGNLISWLLEVGKQILSATYRLSPQHTFICLTTVCAKYSLSSLHIAACLGLSRVCSALVLSGLEMNSRSDLGNPLYCALAGPALLLSDALKIDWGIARKDIRLESRLDTAERLIDLGARPDFLPCLPEKGLSFAAVALMACAARSGPGDIRLFTALCPDEQYFTDEGFFAVFQDPGFPFEPASSGGSDGPPMPRQKKFLDDLCILLIDRSWQNSVPKIWDAAWRKGLEHNLECTSPATRRRLPMDDDTFTEVMLDAMESGLEVDIRYCMQDIRWNDNLPLAGLAEEDRGRTLLHRAVEEGNIALVRLLLERGRADVSISDASGRTPLHLCERSDILRLLVGSGADLRQCDNDGRLLWHYAAANNDVELLRTLLVLDRNTGWVLKQTTKQGRTPLAEALAFVRELNGLPTVPASQYPQFLAGKTQSIWFILGLIGNDAAYLRSDIPIVCYAAEWGSQEMVRVFRAQFSVLKLANQDGSGPLHFLNFRASVGLVREIYEIPGVANLPALNNDGHSPAETIFLAFKPSVEEPNDNAHPSNNAELDREAYMELLTEDVCKSRDVHDRTLWQRFCGDVLLHYAPKTDWSCVVNAISVAVSCFVEKGVIQEFDSSTNTCSFVELSRMICGELADIRTPSWLPTIYLQLIRATTSLEIQQLEDDEDLNFFLQVIKRDRLEYREVFAELESMGVPTALLRG